MAITAPSTPPGAQAPHRADGPPPWRAPVLVGAAAAAGTLLVTIGDPNTTHVPLCPFKAFTGWDCALCGSLRATHSITHGDLGGALDHNIVFTLLVPFLVVGWAIWLARSLGHDVGPHVRLPRWALLTLLGLAFAFGVIRNLPAFSYLAST